MVKEVDSQMGGAWYLNRIRNALFPDCFDYRICYIFFDIAVDFEDFESVRLLPIWCK